MHVTIVDREAAVWEGQASHVAVPAYSGSMGILPGHTPLMTLLQEGHVEVTTDGGKLVFEVSGGFATVTENEVYVVVEVSDEGRAEA